MAIDHERLEFVRVSRRLLWVCIVVEFAPFVLFRFIFFSKQSHLYGTGTDPFRALRWLRFTQSAVPTALETLVAAAS